MKHNLSLVLSPHNRMTEGILAVVKRITMYHLLNGTVSSLDYMTLNN